MLDYWNELDLPKWSKRERFNFIMAYIDSKFDSSDSHGEDTPTPTPTPAPEPTPTPTPEPEPEPKIDTGSLILTVSDNTDVIAGANVTLTGEDNYAGITDNGGECHINDINYGEYAVSVEFAGYETYTGTITINSEEVLESVTLSVLTGDVKITVTDGENPIGSASVSITDTTFTATTGSAGGCTIRNVPLGEYTIEVGKTGYISSLEDLTVNVGENPITITLELDSDDA